LESSSFFSFCRWVSFLIGLLVRHCLLQKPSCSQKWTYFRYGPGLSPSVSTQKKATRTKFAPIFPPIACLFTYIHLSAMVAQSILSVYKSLPLFSEPYPSPLLLTVFCVAFLSSPCHRSSRNHSLFSLPPDQFLFPSEEPPHETSKSSFLFSCAAQFATRPRRPSRSSLPFLLPPLVGHHKPLKIGRTFFLSRPLWHKKPLPIFSPP